jgi:hypothetical protein
LERVIKIQAQVHSVNAVRVDGLKAGSLPCLIETSGERTNFQVLPILVVQLTLKVSRHKLNFFGCTERLTMIGERKRNHTQTRQQALDSAKEQPVCQFASRQRGGEGNGLVAKGLPQSLEPSRGVEDRGIRMPVNEGLPARVS